MEKKYICIRDYQGGEFGMYRDYTAKEWGEQAKIWAESDSWENPNECLLESFKTEEDLLEFIQEMWELEIVELNKNNNEVIEFLKECVNDYNEEYYNRNSIWAKKLLKEMEC